MFSTIPHFLSLQRERLLIEIIYHADGDPIKLPENLETLPRAEHFPTQRHRWNTNEVSRLYLLIFVGHEYIKFADQ